MRDEQNGQAEIQNYAVQYLESQIAKLQADLERIKGKPRKKRNLNTGGISHSERMKAFWAKRRAEKASEAPPATPLPVTEPKKRGRKPKAKPEQ